MEYVKSILAELDVLLKALLANHEAIFTLLFVILLAYGIAGIMKSLKQKDRNLDDGDENVPDPEYW